MSMIPLHFHRINVLQPGTPSLHASRFIPGHGKACFTPRTGYTYPWNALYRDSRRPLTRQSHASFPHPQADMNLYRNRIPSTIPFPRQASDLTRYHVPLRSMLKCEDNMVCWGMVVLRKDRGNHAVSPQSPFASAGPNLRSGTLGTTHRHVTGPQVVPQCSLQEQPSVHAIRISDRFYLSIQSLQTYLSLKGSCSCIPTNNFFYRKIYLSTSLPRIHINGEVNPG
jgi:hypothetical protein